MSSTHALFKFSATLKTDDIAVLHCLRALCQYAEKTRYKFIGWGGTSEEAWHDNSGRVTFHFTNPDYRQDFINEAKELLAGRWSLLNTNNNDPASPQR